MKKMVIAFLVVITASGCATMNGWFNDSNTNARILTKGLVAEYLVHNPGSLDAVYRASTDALTYVSGDTVELGMLYQGILITIQPSIDKLTPEGQAAFLLLITELRDQLVKGLNANGVTDSGKVIIEVKTMITWVHDVAAAKKALGGV